MALNAAKVPTSKTNLPTIYVDGKKILKMVHGSHHLTTSLSTCINNSIETIEAIVAIRQSQVSIKVGKAEFHDMR
jgi:glutamate mutase epsilon subunit